MTGVIKRGNLDIEIGIHRESHVNMTVAIYKSRKKGLEQILPHSPQKEGNLLTT